jgi:hypothetical protein
MYVYIYRERESCFAYFYVHCFVYFEHYVLNLNIFVVVYMSYSWLTYHTIPLDWFKRTSTGNTLHLMGKTMASKPVEKMKRVGETE